MRKHRPQAAERLGRDPWPELRDVAFQVGPDQKEAGASPAPACLIDDAPQYLKHIWRAVDLIENDQLLGMSLEEEFGSLQLGKVLRRFEIEID